ncbi:competence protein CoiA [Cytobacillus spongiae]|uniref:competence protein CoiA n=1 Tax=Cytobacillus spongiae TaxID=2901381 RepID=UPI001F44443F|nr:competence protein CoiA family protein [Cytobacillus spongiae]UII57025.1 competence protein CoiA [Cytobacillus spongiae]
MLLTAINKNGDAIRLGVHLSRFQLTELKRQESFHCPVCGGALYLKIGRKKIPHFAHQKATNCLEHFERESEYHMLGKLQLFDALEQTGVKPTLEPYFHTIKQRPDICFSYGTKLYAVEFQCSTIPEEIFIKRTEQYQQQGITPVWILGGNRLKRKSANTVSLSGFDYLFLSDRGDFHIPYYCPSTTRLIFLQNPHPISTTKALLSLSIYALSALTVLKIVSHIHQPSPLENSWREMVEKYKREYSYFQGRRKDPILMELYQNHLPFHLLPAVIGLPVTFAFFIETSPIVWQAYLYLDVFQHRLKGQIVTFQQAYQSFKIRVRKRQIRLRVLPLVMEGNASLAVMDYLCLICELGYLKKVGTSSFQVVKEMNSPVSSDEFSKVSKEFYESYSNLLGKRLMK